MDVASFNQRLMKWIGAARKALARRECRILARVLSAGVVVLVALKSRSQFGRLGGLGHPDPPWLGAAVAAEIISLLAYARMVREFLRLGGTTASVRSLLRPTLAGIAMGASLPAGVGASNVYWYKQLRRHGADRPLAALTLSGTSAAGALSLIGLLIVGVALAGDAGPVAQIHWPLLHIAAVLLALRLIFAHRLGGVLTQVLRRIAPTVEERHAVRVRRLRTIVALAHANWLFDCAALCASLIAVHASVPARGVILVYVLSQLVANVALIPGGGGTIELSLALGFSAFGDRSATVLAGVLLYRLMNCWGLVPVGWLAVILDRSRDGSRVHTPSGGAQHLQIPSGGLALKGANTLASRQRAWEPLLARSGRRSRRVTAPARRLAWAIHNGSSALRVSHLAVPHVSCQPVREE